MAQITASLVKQLRDQTGAGMMDCKRALTESSGDLEQANDWLRKKGLAAAAKKAGRVAAEGLVGIAISGESGAMAEVNSETDFLARNDIFQDFVRSVADVALKAGGDVEKTLAAAFPGSDGTVSDALTGMIGKIGENMVLRRAAGISVSEGVVAGYVHNQVAPGLGKIGVLVGLESSGDAGKLMEIGRQLAMHICAALPSAVSRDEVDQAQVRRERDILAEQARASGKPPEIIDKMVDGRMRKYYEEVVLMEQIFVIDGETKVGDFIEASGKEIGTPIKITGFMRLGLGEGVEKKESDFAAEVAAQAGG